METLPKFTLARQIWNDSDFEQMGWQDCRIHAFAFGSIDPQTGTTEFLFDLDYILQWINPVPPEGSYQFWVAPCTLVFESVFDIEVNFQSRGNLEIEDIERVPQQMADKSRNYWKWTISCQEGEITFFASGFRQFVRSTPVLGKGRVVDLSSRGGHSFGRVFKP